MFWRFSDMSLLPPPTSSLPRVGRPEAGSATKRVAGSQGSEDRRRRPVKAGRRVELTGDGVGVGEVRYPVGAQAVGNGEKLSISWTLTCGGDVVGGPKYCAQAPLRDLELR